MAADDHRPFVRPEESLAELTAFTSIAGALGLPALTIVDGPVGAWLALAPLAVIAWILVRVPLREGARARSET
jgi:hypothetical protein